VRLIAELAVRAVVAARLLVDRLPQIVGLAAVDTFVGLL
jgi:hypothetical protein